MKNRKASLARNQNIPSAGIFSGQILIGDSQPPRNRMLIRPQSSMTFMYSARKNSRKGPEEYSTKKPATSSDSASSRSKGGRWVSARDETKKMISIGNRMEKTFQFRNAYQWLVSWACTIWETFNEPANSSTVMMTKPIETSKNTIRTTTHSADRK